MSRITYIKEPFFLFLADDTVLGRMPDLPMLSGVPTFSMSGPGSGVDTTSSSACHPLPSVTGFLPSENSGVSSLAIPPKLLKRILNLEFVEMAELIPGSWGVESETATACCHQVRPQPRRGPITNILLWLDCYSLLVAALVTKFPQYMGDFMAYQRTIIRASKNFEGAAWVLYDRGFRRRAAATKTLDWGRIDSALYNEMFTGRARSIARCRVCLSDDHMDADCPEGAGMMPSRASGHGHAGWTYHNRSTSHSEILPARGSLSHMSQSTEVCQLFNKVRCRSTWCKRRHVCNRCGLPHPEIVSPERRGRSRSP